MKTTYPTFTILSISVLAVLVMPSGISADNTGPTPCLQAEIPAEQTPISPSDSIADDPAFDTALDEVTVETRRKLVESDGAKLSYNVSEDPEAGSSNILDILRKVPGVQVDAEENVKVNGQSSFKILMNGREDPMLQGDLKTILKSLPAGSLKKIEVISEPGAKYEAEGVGGILNLVTDSGRTLSGFLTQLGAWVNAYQAGGYINARTKVKKVMLDANVSFNDGKLWPRPNKSEREIQSLVPGNRTLQHISQRIKSGWDYTGAKLNMSWEPDTLNLFTLSANYGYNSWNNYGWEVRSMSLDENLLWKYNRRHALEGNYNGVSASVSYQHNFNREDHNLVASYQFNYDRQDNHTDYFFENESGLPQFYSPYNSNRNTGNSFCHIIQLDYTNRFNPHHLMEAGAKANINDNGNHSEPWTGVTMEDAILDRTLEVKLNQLKDIYALYGSYSGTFGNWSVKAGLRYEHTRMGLRYHIGDYPNFTTRLNDIVPNMAASYNITPASSIRAAYQMRISRPWIDYVNPYIDILTPGQIRYGNPDLKSEKAHNVSLSYSNYDHKLSGSVKLNYRYLNNSITDIIFMKDGVINYTYANVGKSHTGTLDLNLNWSPVSAFRWGLDASLSYTYLKAESELISASNKGWQTFLSTDLSYTFPGKWRLSGYGGYYTPWIDLQSRGTQDGYYYGLGLGKSWLKDDALSLNLSVGTLLPLHSTRSYVQEDESVRLSYKTHYSQWNLSMSLSYRFGGLKSEVRKTAAVIEKEATSSGSQKGSN